MSTHQLKFGEIKTQRGLDGILEVEVTEKVRLSQLKPTMKANVRKALRNGAAPVEASRGGKLAGLYSILCKRFDMPEAYLSKNSKGLYVAGLNDELFQQLEAMHMLTRTEARTYGYYGNLVRRSTSRYDYCRDYRTEITYDALVRAIETYRPMDLVKVEAAVKLIDEGAIITYKHQPIIA